jgi:hypothetical protein
MTLLYESKVYKKTFGTCQLDAIKVLAGIVFVGDLSSKLWTITR